MKIHRNKDRRKKQYEVLRAAGFNSYESTRYKDLSNKKIISLIESRTAYKVITESILKEAK